MLLSELLNAGRELIQAAKKPKHEREAAEAVVRDELGYLDPQELVELVTALSAMCQNLEKVAHEETKEQFLDAAFFLNEAAGSLDFTTETWSLEESEAEMRQRLLGHVGYLLAAAK